MTLPDNTDRVPGGKAPRKSPRQLAGTVGDYVLGALTLMLWIFIAAVGVSAFYVGLRAVWWATQIVLKALGV